MCVCLERETEAEIERDRGLGFVNWLTVWMLARQV